MISQLTSLNPTKEGEKSEKRGVTSIGWASPQVLGLEMMVVGGIREVGGKYVGEGAAS